MLVRATRAQSKTLLWRSYAKKVKDAKQKQKEDVEPQIVDGFRIGASLEELLQSKTIDQDMYKHLTSVKQTCQSFTQNKYKKMSNDTFVNHFLVNATQEEKQQEKVPKKKKRTKRKL